MALLADLISLGEPPRDFVVNFFHARKTKRVEMVAGRKRFDPAKARIFETSRQDHMAVHPFLANDDRGETHPNLKRDPRFLGQNDDRAVLFRQGQ